MKGLLFLVLASLAAPLVLWQHSCGISIASKLNLTLLDVFELSPLLTLLLVWQHFSPLSFSAPCDQIAFDVTSFFPDVIYRSVSRVSADITMLLVQRPRENVFPIDVVLLLLWSHTGETPIQKSPRDGLVSDLSLCFWCYSRFLEWWNHCKENLQSLFITTQACGIYFRKVAIEQHNHIFSETDVTWCPVQVLKGDQTLSMLLCSCKGVLGWLVVMQLLGCSRGLACHYAVSRVF